MEPGAGSPKITAAATRAIDRIRPQGKLPAVRNGGFKAARLQLSWFGELSGLGPVVRLASSISPRPKLSVRSSSAVAAEEVLVVDIAAHKRGAYQIAPILSSSSCSLTTKGTGQIE